MSKSPMEINPKLSPMHINYHPEPPADGFLIASDEPSEDSLESADEDTSTVQALTNLGQYNRLKDDYPLQPPEEESEMVSPAELEKSNEQNVEAKQTTKPEVAAEKNSTDIKTAKAVVDDKNTISNKEVKDTHIADKKKASPAVSKSSTKKVKANSTKT